MVDRVIKILEFSTRIRRVKAVCIAAGVEGGRQAVKEHVVSEKFDL